MKIQLAIYFFKLIFPVLVNVYIVRFFPGCAHLEGLIKVLAASAGYLLKALF